MRILGIETSCDETAAAVVEDGIKILSNVVASSSEMHAKTGGIIPEVAARQQVVSILPVMQNAMSNVKCQMSNIDAIAVTVGPGLIGSLLVGIETAKTLSYLWKKPIIPINHLVAHIYANWIDTSEQWTVDGEQKKTSHHTPHTIHQPQFPVLALVVSGGHTDLVLMKNHRKLTWIGGTRDDAAGEAFDKCARILGLPYPGGPAISAAAEKYFNQSPFTNHHLLNMFPRPLINEVNYDWSFSGLKTAVLRRVKEPFDKAQGKQGSKIVKEKLSISLLAAEVQEAIVDSLVEKSLRAIKEFKPRSFLLAGGVAANKRLREKFLSRIKTEILQVFHVPPANLCTDNAASIASCAFYNYHPVDWKKIKANPGLTIVGEI